MKSTYILLIFALLLVAFSVSNVEACYGCPLLPFICNNYCKSKGNSYGKCQSTINWTCV
ncbi:hypothetical protein X975_09733, partial [Stegodyphus mimosarum]